MISMATVSARTRPLFQEEYRLRLRCFNKNL